MKTAIGEYPKPPRTASSRVVTSRRRRFLLAMIMAGICLTVAAVATLVTYRLAVGIQGEALVERARDSAALLEAISRHSGPQAAIRILDEVQEQTPPTGQTGELTVGRLDGGQIVYVVRRSASGEDSLLSIPLQSNRADLMRRALAGKESWLVDTDYRGRRVLAAQQSIPELGWGIVTKMDLAEVRAPFWNALFATGAVALLLVAGGVIGFVRASEPFLKEIEVSERQHRILFHRLAEAQRIARLGSWELDIASGELTWSDEIYRIFGLAVDEIDPTYEEFLERIEPEDREAVTAEIEQALAEDIPYRVEHRIVRPDGEIRWVAEHGEVERSPSGEPVKMIGTVQDVTERRVADERLATILADLERSNLELERSNTELQQFAYVASHDLQEPLRMVVSYLGLIERRIGDQLDERTRKFMGYAVDGGRRMQQLINDLLAYSRIHTRDIETGPIELDRALSLVCDDLQQAIEETGARVSWNGLPTVLGDPTQLTQLFQNLVGNALKFHGESPPRVEITATEMECHWELAVRDEGIGIAPEFADRIFDIFQRLHTQGEYPGTGIGLAICKRIVDRHGGRIWVESRPGSGATFYFTLPKDRESADES